MAYLKFTIEYFNDDQDSKTEKPWMKSGVALKGIAYPEKISELTPAEARIFLMHYNSAMQALLRLQKDKIVSAGVLTQQEAYGLGELPLQYQEME